MLRTARIDAVAQLRAIPLLASLSLDDLSQLYHFCTPHMFAAGEMVLREGENDDGMFFILRGKMDVLGEFACTIPAPDYIGQDGISPFVQRKTGVRARERVQALRLARRDFVDVYDAFADAPFAAELERIVTDVGLRSVAHLREYMRDVDAQRPAVTALPRLTASGANGATPSAPSPATTAAHRPATLPSRRRIAEVVGLRGADAAVLFRKLRALEPSPKSRLGVDDFVRCVARMRTKIGLASDAPRDAEAAHVLGLLHACVGGAGSGAGATCANLCYACVATLALNNTCAAVFELSSNAAREAIPADDVRAMLIAFLAVARGCGGGRRSRGSGSSAPAADAAEAEAMLNRARGDMLAQSLSFARFSAAFKAWMASERFADGSSLDPSKEYYIFHRCTKAEAGGEVSSASASASSFAAAAARHLSYSINRPTLYEDTGDVDDLVAWALRPVPGAPGSYRVIEPKFGKHLVHDKDGGVSFRALPEADVNGVNKPVGMEVQWTVEDAPMALNRGHFSIVARANGRRAKRDTQYLAPAMIDASEEATALCTGEDLVLRELEWDVKQRVGRACPSVETDFASRRVLLRRPVVFVKGLDELMPGSKEVLRQLADVVQAASDAAAVRGWPPVKMQIEGHVNNVDNPRAADMIDLSQQRAEAVVEHLVALGVDSRVLVARGFGGARPLRDGDSKRVEVTLISEAQQPPHHRENTFAWRIVETALHLAGGTLEASDYVESPALLSDLQSTAAASLSSGALDTAIASRAPELIAAGLAAGLLAMLPTSPLPASAVALVKECYAGVVHHGPAISHALACCVAARDPGECVALSEMAEPVSEITAALGPAVERLKLVAVMASVQQRGGAQPSEDVTTLFSGSASAPASAPQRASRLAINEPALSPSRASVVSSVEQGIAELDRLAQLGRLRAELARSEREQAKLQKLAASLRHTCTAQQTLIRTHETTIKAQAGTIMKLQDAAMGGCDAAQAVDPSMASASSKVAVRRRVVPLRSPKSVETIPQRYYGALPTKLGSSSSERRGDLERREERLAPALPLPRPQQRAAKGTDVDDWRPHAFLFIMQRRDLKKSFRNLREQCLFFGQARKQQRGATAPTPPRLLAQRPRPPVYRRVERVAAQPQPQPQPQPRVSPNVRVSRHGSISITPGGFLGRSMATPQQQQGRHAAARSVRYIHNIRE